jgi:hypothetical protein
VPDETPPASERAEALVNQAGRFARWATKAGAEFARSLPGASAVETELQQLERTVLGELRRRLDNVDPLRDGRATPDDEPPVRPAATAPPKQTEPLRVAMAELLLRSIEQTRQRAREYLYLTILRQLLPDEARILSALADGSAYPLLHVDCRTGVTGTRRLLSNASTVGRAAGVAVPRQVPRYLTRLLHLDLVEVGELDPALAVQYDICLTEELVREAEDAARADGRARLLRQTVRISPLGRELWDACHPRDEQTWDEPTRAEPEPAVPAPDPEPEPHLPAVTVPWEVPADHEPTTNGQ